MCGLVGVAGNLEFKDESLFKRLLIFDYFRGTDSTGAAWLKKNGDISIVKLPSHPIDLFNMKQFDSGINGAQSLVFLGHNRAATMGKVNGVNAHPFKFGSIVGAHNGTLMQCDWDDLDKETGTTTNVDSAALFNAIDQIGVKNTIEMVHEGVTPQRGAWALTWFDAEEKVLYLLKNKHRPLWCAYSKDLTKIIWASESWMIQSAVESSKTPYELWEDEEGYTYFPLKDNMLYTIDLEELASKGKKTPPDWTTEEIKGKTFTASASAGTAPFLGNQQQSKKTSNSSTDTTECTVLSFNQQPIIELGGDSHRPFANYIDKTDFDEIAKYGCSWCGKEVKYDDLGVIIWERTDQLVGNCCSGETHRNIVHADPERYEQYFGSKRKTA
jgi:predicted glutamine amidotransferase